MTDPVYTPDQIEKRLSAIASNAIAAAMELYGRFLQTDDDAGRRDAIFMALHVEATKPTPVTATNMTLVAEDQAPENKALQAALEALNQANTGETNGATS